MAQESREYLNKRQQDVGRSGVYSSPQVQPLLVKSVLQDMRTLLIGMVGTSTYNRKFLDTNAIDDDAAEILAAQVRGLEANLLGPGAGTALADAGVEDLAFGGDLASALSAV